MFEYRVWTFLPHKLTDEALQAELNNLGSQGWELVAVMDSGRQAFEKRALLKRAVLKSDLTKKGS